MGFSPIDQGLTFPTPYPLESCPFHSTLHYRSWLWFILFDVRIYMMLNYNVPDSTIYHRQRSPLPKHTQQNRWWGFFLELLTTINYIIYIMQTGSKPGTLHSPPPWNNTVLGVPLHIYNTYTIAHQNFKILQICPMFNHPL